MCKLAGGRGGGRVLSLKEKETLQPGEKRVLKWCSRRKRVVVKQLWSQNGGWGQ